MNPMRSLGPALVSGDLHALWLYLVAPIVGAVARRARLPVRPRRAARPAELRPPTGSGGSRVNVLFVCVANSGRSVMAERLFREAAQGRHQARSAGSEPGSAPHPQVVEALREIGIDASDHVPRRLDDEALEWADVAVSTCSEEVCPVTPGVRRISWVFAGPEEPAARAGARDPGRDPTERRAARARPRRRGDSRVRHVPLIVICRCAVARRVVAP